MTAGPALLAAVDATWPPAETRDLAGWRLRRGLGGGQRVSAASVLAPGAVPEIALAEAVMRAWGQLALMRLSEEGALDAALAARGYRLADRVTIFAAPPGALATEADETARLIRVTAELRVVDEIWAGGGVGPARRAVMRRVAGPSAVLLARLGDRPAGVAFVAEAGGVAMLHAVEVRPEARRQGLGTRLLEGAANWAREVGADTLALAVTDTNAPAVTLYEKLGLAPAARYHYRQLDPAEGA